MMAIYQELILDARKPLQSGVAKPSRVEGLLDYFGASRLAMTIFFSGVPLKYVRTRRRTHRHFLPVDFVRAKNDPE